VPLARRWRNWRGCRWRARGLHGRKLFTGGENRSSLAASWLFTGGENECSLAVKSPLKRA